MAKGRFISKEISLDEKVDSLSDDTARLLYTWMIPHLDVEGRIYGDPQVFKAIVAPRRNYSNKRIAKYLAEFESKSLIERYAINGNAYISVKTFEKHQTGLRKEKEAQSRIPPKTTDLVRSKGGVTPSQDKDKDKDKDKNNIVTDAAENMVNDVKAVYTLFENEIHQLTPLISEEINKAIDTYPHDWILDAIKESAKNGVRKWKYINAILESWKANGKGSKKATGRKKGKDNWSL